MNKKNALIFMSGSGSNAEALIRYTLENPDCAFEISGLVTDRPGRSRTGEIAKNFHLPVLALDIFEFYAQFGEKNIGLINPLRWEIREKWTAELRRMLKESKLGADFILLAGFEPLSNITCDYPALNVHPGDLTVERNKLRILNGLGVKPVELAITEDFGFLRSSVIVAQPFSGKDSDVDSGPILGISPKIPVDLLGFELSHLQELYRNRPAKLPKGFSDDLRKVAEFNIDKLKYAGDHVVFPQAANDYAKGKFVFSGNDLSYLIDGDMVRVKTVEYSKDAAPRPIF